jgi:hypothetical protein
VYFITLFKWITTNFKFKIYIKDLILIFFLLVYLFFRVSQVSIEPLIYLSTYYFGFVFFYLFFISTRIKVDLSRILYFFCLEILLEATLINTILPAKFWKNYPLFEEGSPHFVVFFDFFQRPYSIGSNSTVTSTLLVILFIQVKQFASLSIWKEILVFFSIALCLSGTGLSLYFLYILSTKIKFKFRDIFTLLTIVGACFIVIELLSTTDYSKFSSIYVNSLIELKLSQIDDYILKLNNLFQLFFGYNHKFKFDVITYNDFSLNDAFFNLGILGVLFYFFFIVSHISKFNKVSILFFVVAALHYGAIFNIFGQFLFGYLLSLKNTSGRFI